MSNDTTPYFFPDPYNTGEGVSIEAVSLEDALKQLKKHAPKDESQPEDQPRELPPEAVEPAKENS